MQEIKIFNHKMFGDIRAMTADSGEVLFVGKDVATALGYANTQKAIRDHVDDEDKLTERIVLSGQNRAIVVINESGLYALILSSKLPQAKAFKRWVTSEVLPQIRQTGGYIPTHDAEGRQLTSEEILQQAELIVGRTLRLLNAPNEHCLTATEVALKYACLLLEIADLRGEKFDEVIIERKGTKWWVHFAVCPKNNGMYVACLNKGY